MTNHQRVDAPSNSFAGREFEDLALAYFAEHENLQLWRSFAIDIGHGPRRKSRRFDLGSEDPPVLVECKSHRWTITGKNPSAKFTLWNEAMYYFHLSPARYRKVLFVLYAMHESKRETLAEYYVRRFAHLIPPGVEIIEFDSSTGNARQIWTDLA